MATTYTNPASHTMEQPFHIGLGQSSTSAVIDAGTKNRSSKNGREFMFVCVDSDGVAPISGAPCVFTNCTAQLVVTADCSEAITAGGGGAFAGTFCSDQTCAGGAGKFYMWIQTKGRVPGAYGEDLTAGDALAVGNQLGNYFVSIDDIATGNDDHYVVVGYALASGSSSKGDIVLI